MSDEKETPNANKKVLRSLGFVAVVAVVLGVFFYLSSLDAPPDLPKNDTHSFRFDGKLRLIGLKSESLAGDSGNGENTEYDLKAVEKRINTTCRSCHGSFPQPADKIPRICEQMNAPCLPAKHPPKETCIKCHRVGG